MNYEELMAKVRGIRKARTVATEEAKAKPVKARKPRQAKNKADKLIDSLSPAERLELLKRLGATDEG